MVCEAFGSGSFAYVSHMYNDMCEEFDVYLTYAFRPQTPKNRKKALDKRMHHIEVKNSGHLKQLNHDFKLIKELR